MADPLILNQRDPSQLFGQTGTAVVDFGPFPGRSDASVAVTGQTGINANAVLEAWIVATATVDHSVDDHVFDAPSVKGGNIVPGAGFTIYAASIPGIVSRNNPRNHGKWTVGWRWTN
jgi:hypothetical protein